MTNKEFMIPEERAEAEKMEAEKKSEALKENIEQMTQDEIDERLGEIEARFREIDELASKRESAEKAFGANAYDKMQKEYTALEKERALLLVKRPEAIVEENIIELDHVIDAAPTEEKEEIKQPAAMVPIDQVKKMNIVDMLYGDLEKAPADIARDLRLGWQALGQMLKRKEKPIWWPEAKKLELVEVIETDEAVPLPTMEIEFEKAPVVVSIRPTIDLAQVIAEKKLEALKEKFVTPQKAKIAAAEAGWDEIAEALDAKKSKEEDEKIRQTEQYKTYLKAFENLGQPFKDMPIRPRGGDLLLRFLDEVTKVGKEGSDLKKAGELIYEDILVGEVKMKPGEWEWKNRVALRNEQLNYMLLGELTKEEARLEKQMNERAAYIQKLEHLTAFKAATEVWSYLAAMHNLEVEQKIDEEHLKNVKKELEKERKGKRSPILPKPESLFRIKTEWLDFPEVEIEEEAAEKAA